MRHGPCLYEDTDRFFEPNGFAKFVQPIIFSSVTTDSRPELDECPLTLTPRNWWQCQNHRAFAAGIRSILKGKMSQIFGSIVAMLATERLTKLEVLIQTGRAGEYLMQEYPLRELENLTPDTQDAAAAANYRMYLHDRAN